MSLPAFLSDSRYDAALELCPLHKEGLVARGAALTNLGRAREALRDFDAALQIDPENANALKYREIARKRGREELAVVAEDAKRRRANTRYQRVHHTAAESEKTPAVLQPESYVKHGKTPGYSAVTVVLKFQAAESAMETCQESGPRPSRRFKI
ncbi:hypothetical protein AK812_SmicGene28293 [Symbiodinium microadriaticum]|uniref:Uncharacterized protein n=1 Tax=Symbiodinium microadriaticum TaxID=2951 RepID=A0A1Q9D4S7_SYMMI|nr:hypothetical protein AK812_SmicGene28293 [Symbiodinium microadriaticum]